MAEPVLALIVDIVDSRHLEDRLAAEREIREAFLLAEGHVTFIRSLWPTVGDEFQAVLPSVGEALLATSVVRLALAQSVDVRFGLGWGDARPIDEQAPDGTQDGSAWWRAREAISSAGHRQKSGSPYVRSWFADGAARPSEQARECSWSSCEADLTGASVVNSYLLMRDQLISTMKPRSRRLALGALLGRTQTEQAAEEGIGQGAVSQNLSKSGGAALRDGLRLFQKARLS